MRPKNDPPKPKGHVRSNQQRKDDSIMNTNDSSIVSKRSVSKLYFPDEPDFYEPFVQKHMRRSPLINRGYWLRMHAVEHVVRRFLQENTEKSKTIVNLGCGYDPLPFQFWHRRPLLSRNAVFVDVDYPQLIGRKRDRILTNDLLREALFQTNVRSSKAPVYVRSDGYMALGCDLRDLGTLERILQAEIDLSNSSILFVGEVSLTYMSTTDSDSLIQWASTFEDARFCLLEQYLPQGPHHPFAQTMLGHFDKLQTHIHAVERYPSLGQQSSRFAHAGWSTIEIARNLWDLWSDEAFTPTVTRRRLDTVEPFDEWEEFALFGGHYFLLLASNVETGKPVGSTTAESFATGVPGISGRQSQPMTLTHHAAPSHPKLTPHRFGAAFTVGQSTVAFHGGQGLQSRLASMSVLGQDISKSMIQPCNLTPPQARMCHTVTAFDDRTALLVGGRTSPAHALADCWVTKDGTWQQVHDLRPARFRHSSVGVTISSDESNLAGVLVFGGKTSEGTVLDEWTLWTASQGWQTIAIDGTHPSARFGAAISMIGSAHSDQCWGYLVGGMASSGVILDEIWEWHVTAAPHPQLRLIDRTNDVRTSSKFPMLGRMGAQLVPYEDSVLLIGGVSRKEVLSLSDDFLLLSHDPRGGTLHIANPTIALPKTTWPLLVGVGAAAASQNKIVFAGGGAVCFSMGSYWNESYFVITAGTTVPQPFPMSQYTTEAKASPPTTVSSVDGKPPAKARSSASSEPVVLPRVKICSPRDFADLLAVSKPAILEGLDLGPCRELWTLEYLKEKIGASREVVIHACDSDRMTFQDKNFHYEKRPFGAFIDGLLAGSQTYLRAVSSRHPTKQPTSLAEDFPTIAPDFKLPPALAFVDATTHSSPLRISGPVALWLHYDVLANVLCQIRGTKTLHLYPPSDVNHLAYPPGGSSSNVDVLASKPPALRRTHPHVASLRPGDILFIPPLWSHTAKPDEGASVAVNVFFRNLGRGYAAGRDVYGNRDLQAYENGRRDVERIVKAFRGVPSDMAGFYLDRLLAELREKADSLGGA